MIEIHKQTPELFTTVTNAVLQAGRAILEVYGTEFSVDTKDDASPLTEADRRSHEIIVRTLDGTFPVLSEEGRQVPFEERKSWDAYWLIDPLDGTKEFVKRNGEFTVNVALIEQGVPTAGWVYVPVKDLLYAGSMESGARRFEGVSATEGSVLWDNGTSLPAANHNRPFTVVASRSHLTEDTARYIDTLEAQHGPAVRISAGSSLKLCMVAEGSADVYPRFAPTMEWDTAAADAVCRASGAAVGDAETGAPLVYNKQDLHNPWFIVSANHENQTSQ